MIATEKKSSSLLIDSSALDKVSIICPNIGLVYSGMGPDFRVLVNNARKSAQAYWKIYGEYPPTRVLTQQIASVMQQATQSGCARFCYTWMKDILMAFIEVYVRMVFPCWWQAGMPTGGQVYIKSTHQVRSGHGKPAQ